MKQKLIVGTEGGDKTPKACFGSSGVKKVYLCGCGCGRISTCMPDIMQMHRMANARANANAYALAGTEVRHGHAVQSETQPYSAFRLSVIAPASEIYGADAGLRLAHPFVLSLHLHLHAENHAIAGTGDASGCANADALGYAFARRRSVVELTQLLFDATLFFWQTAPSI